MVCVFFYAPYSSILTTAIFLSYGFGGVFISVIASLTVATVISSKQLTLTLPRCTY